MEGSWEGKLYVCNGSQNFLFYCRAEKRMIADILGMDQ